MNLKLKQVRKENGYSQADLADALNVDINFAFIPLRERR